MSNKQTAAATVSMPNHSPVEGHVEKMHDAVPTHSMHALHGDNVFGDLLDDTVDADDLQMLADMGMQAQDVAELTYNLANHAITYQQALGVSDAEMEAMEFRAFELLRQGKAARAAKVFVGLTKLNRFEARYFRGAGLAFQHSRNWGMAYGAFDLALATDPNDRISEALRAESMLYVLGKADAIVAFDAYLARPETPGEQPDYRRRAASIRQLLR